MTYDATETEISTPTPATMEGISFTKRLRQSLEALEAGKAITLRTKEDRQTVTNVVLATKKKTGFALSTHLLQKRDDEGKIVIEIQRTA